MMGIGLHLLFFVTLQERDNLPQKLTDRLFSVVKSGGNYTQTCDKYDQAVNTLRPLTVCLPLRFFYQLECRIKRVS